MAMLPPVSLFREFLHSIKGVHAQGADSVKRGPLPQALDSSSKDGLLADTD